MLQPKVTAKVPWVIHRLSELTLGVFVDLAVGEAAFMSNTFVDHVTEPCRSLYFFGLTGNALNCWCEEPSSSGLSRMHPTNVSEEVLIMNLNLVEVAILAIVDGTTGDVSFLSDAFRHQILNFSRVNHSLINFLFHFVYAAVSRLTIRSFHLLIDGFHCRTGRLRGPKIFVYLYLRNAFKRDLHL
uniref:(northern house mosquito) hypothetical protein n=2 Tax=Culex pipiens TaxID=7175 RepID=A0A8D8F4G6_CULPI